MSERKHTMISRECRYCGKPFEVPAAAAKFDPRRGRYCSVRCGRYGNRRPMAERFASYVSTTPDANGCLLWTGRTNNAGYGQILEGGRGTKTLLAHRVAWELVNGPIPDKKILLHTCDNPRCVAVAHLVPGSYSDNSMDMMLKNRGNYRLTPDAVRAIRQAYESREATIGDLSKRYGVWETTIADAIFRRTWSHVA